MAEPPELWAFVLANAAVFISGSLLAALSYLAYLRGSGQPSYRFATVGFGLVVMGGLVEPAYQLQVGIDYTLDGSQLLLLQTGESAFIGLGLGLLFYAITRHESVPTVDDRSARTDEGIKWRRDSWDGEQDPWDGS